MISLKKDNIVMEVATELQTSVFLRNGYERIDAKADTVAAVTDPTDETAAEKPKRRARRTKSAE